MPRVSIVLTILNEERYLRECLDSCFGQTYSDFELIVVDGGSTDGTLDILAGYDDPRLRLVHQRDNAGKLPGAINLGLEQAAGEYLTWMQGDSVYHPRAIEVMVQALDDHPEVGQVYADFWQTDEALRIEKLIECREPEEFLDDLGDPGGVCFMIRRAVREVVGPHDIYAYPTQDYDYRLRIALQFQSFHICEPLYYWRMHPQSLSGSRPWIVDARNDVRVRQRLGLSDAHHARHLLARVEMAYAFDCYQHNQRAQVPAFVYAALVKNPRYALNRGVWSILVRSLPASAVSGMKGTSRA